MVNRGIAANGDFGPAPKEDLPSFSVLTQAASLTMEQGDIVKAHCNICAGERNHQLLHFHSKEWTEEVDDYGSYVSGEDRYELLQCAGCERVTLRHSSYFSENTDDDGRVVPTVSYYPPATFRRKPRWLSGSGRFLFIGQTDFVPRLLNEIYTALHGECLSLAAMGVRALLERVMIDRVGDHDSFAENLKAFADKGYVAAHQSDILKATLDVGHASIHRNYTPTLEDIRLALDITENVIEMVYVSHEQAAELKRRTPPRK